MTIRVDFDTYDEMISFSQQLLGGIRAEEPAPAKTEEPEQEPVKEPEPEPAQKEEEPAKEEKKYSLTEVRAFLGDLRKNGKKEAVSALIRDMGYSKFTEIPEEKFPELMGKARAL